MRNLVVVLGDQLDSASTALEGFDPALDRVWMAEVAEESTHVWSHKVRIVMFLSAMRHFAAELAARGWDCDYQRLDHPANTQKLASELTRAIERHRPAAIVVTQPGEWRVEQAMRDCAQQAGVPLEIRVDDHFFCPLAWFRRWSAGRKQLRLEFFYREMRKMHGILMNGGQPEGGQWNFDASNRKSFPRSGPGLIPAPVPFAPDEITREVIALVESRFQEHPGLLSQFNFAVTPEQAGTALQDFVHNRLPRFGLYQDAMWDTEPYLYHSRLSAALNLKLISPRRVVAAAEAAYRDGSVPLAAAEGFIRQILGWREYVRGIYWSRMPEYAAGNALNAHAKLPWFYWDAQTDMNCLRAALRQTLDYGYAHHIQRLMVTGLYAMLLGVEPRAIHEWYLAIYVDAVEWVELPNVIGMSQFADGGVMGSKPYAASGKYIDRMSNYCAGCRYDPGASTGENACPFTTLYWDFLQRNEKVLRHNARMELQLRNLDKLDAETRREIQDRARRLGRT